MVVVDGGGAGGRDVDVVDGTVDDVVGGVDNPAVGGGTLARAVVDVGPGAGGAEPGDTGAVTAGGPGTGTVTVTTTGAPADGSHTAGVGVAWHSDCNSSRNRARSCSNSPFRCACPYDNASSVTISITTAPLDAFASVSQSGADLPRNDTGRHEQHPRHQQVDGGCPVAVHEVHNHAHIMPRTDHQ